MSRRCLFLDRDGVVNVKQPDGQYVCHWSQFEFLPPVFDWIRLFKTAGFLVIVVTNQRCVARGLITDQELHEIHRRMRAALAAAGAAIDDLFVCPHEEGVCDCRKPRTGLIEQAQSKWSIDLPNSILIGDSPSDRQLAENCGIGFVQVAGGRVIACDPRWDRFDAPLAKP